MPYSVDVIIRGGTQVLFVPNLVLWNLQHMPSTVGLLPLEQVMDPFQPFTMNINLMTPHYGILLQFRMCTLNNRSSDIRQI